MNTKKVMKIVGTVAIWFIFAVSLIMVIFTLNTNQNGIANIFGLGYLTVQSDSMDPTFKKGDLIYVTTTSADSVFHADPNDGDVVTFRTIINGVRTLNTHRIIESRESNGQILYTTQGDNPNITVPDLLEITSNDIVAKYTGVKLGGVGYVMDFVNSSLGFFLVIVLPLAALFVYQIIHFAVLMSRFKHEAIVASGAAALTDEQKAEIARQYLESLNTKAAEQPKQEAKEEPVATEEPVVVLEETKPIDDKKE